MEENDAVLDYTKIFHRNEDFKNNSRFWLSVPYIFDEKISDILATKCVKEWEGVKESFSARFEAEFASKKTVLAWKKKRIFPLILVSLLKDFGVDEFEVYKNAESFTDRKITTRINPPRTKREMSNEKLFYIGGVIVGDGCLESSSTLAIYDGHSDPDCLKYSEQFLRDIESKLKSTLGINKVRIYRHKRNNKYVLKVYNKLLTRFVNHIFNMPYGKKSDNDMNPQRIFDSLGLDGRELKISFCRGLLDTDGSMPKGSRNVILVSKNLEILKWVKESLSDIEIDIPEIKGIKNGYELRIPISGFSDFRNKIGFLHPRKRIVQESLFAKEVKLIKFCGVKRGVIDDDYFDLIKIPNIRVIGMGKMVRNMMETEGYTSRRLARELNISGPYLSEIINDKKSSELRKFWPHFISLHGENAYKMLDEFGAKFKSGARAPNDNSIRLPISYDPEIAIIASMIRPCASYRMRVKKGNEDVLGLIKKHFDVDLAKDREGAYIINSTIFTQFFSTFFEYKKRWYM